MLFDQVRNLLSELRNTITTEWKLFQKFDAPVPDPDSEHPDVDLRRLLQDTTRDRHLDESLTDEYKAHYADTRYGFEESDHMKGEPYEFYAPADPASFPDNRQPAPGITVLPYKYHKERTVTATPDTPETGFEMHPLLSYLITTKYPEYRNIATKYARPLGTTDATFADFNKEQKEFPPIPTATAIHIISIVTFLLNACPFLPLHWIDTYHAKMPLHTGTSYFYRHSYEMRTHAAFSHSTEYAGKQTSKGYYFNAFATWSRTVTHRIKQYGLPFTPTNLSPEQIKQHLRSFFLEHPTMLFTRNHISRRDGILKQRPVYAMDTLFLHLECMITFPLHVMARSMKSSIMYSIETIRGGCQYIDSLAMKFRSYLCIDWSSFDQRMPWIIVELFFTIFLPSLLIISHGYAPTAEYPTYPGLTSEKMFTRIFNIICFLRTWYFNCVFLSADGYAYVRRFAGIASGMLNTQYLDSFCNLFLLIHALLHFGCTTDEIFDIVYFVMGDDNVLLTNWPYPRLCSFLSFLESHALNRFGMTLSLQKSIVTRLRDRIEMLGYRTAYGYAQRDTDKLIAQLCFPEHGAVDKFMSSRAIGIAYASAGNDRHLYHFCRDVYLTFLPYAVPADKLESHRIAKFLPGMFKMLDDITEFVNPDEFPSIEEIRSRYRHWQGELDQDRKWSKAHFLAQPDYAPHSFQTMRSYMLDNNIEFPDVERLF